ncbi:hypothetical protein SAMN05216330_10297 [Bradyrhizobium sp. Ghvi]|uniref:hypothetical protein n=1 Tax=Bradyrhizobium sp. Ghvi TaxID=1855319 RepID=UPI0008ECCD1A|nr:hypothetical protein [Bradyrhizobium sp. Ghvi]SFO17794.1 hypothetical protein SAMN05216330_10297 [Bradyrhizobium sp. Ghvi]
MSKKKTALPLDDTPSVVLLGNGERMKRDRAEALGYTIVGETPKGSAPNTALDAFNRWKSQVSCLPEAQERPAALAELLSTHNQTTLDVGKARAFLRGLPVEEVETTEDNMTTKDDPRAARRAEIAGSMQAFNHSRGWTKPQTVALKPTPAVSTVEPDKLKRLAEIRFNALQMNGHGHTQEAKKLKCALDAHATTGAPLSRLLAQLEVDTSKVVHTT